MLIRKHMKTLKTNIEAVIKDAIKKIPSLPTLSKRYTPSIIQRFQEQLLSDLSQRVTEIQWEMEYKMFFDKRDRIDIYGQSPDTTNNNSIDFIVIIEIDNTRADQVGKKIASRFAFAGNTSCLYVAICYPGNKSNKKECQKYFQYGTSLLKKLNPDSEFLGIIINNDMSIESYDDSMMELGPANYEIRHNPSINDLKYF